MVAEVKFSACLDDVNYLLIGLAEVVKHLDVTMTLLYFGCDLSRDHRIKALQYEQRFAVGGELVEKIYGVYYL